MPVRLLALMVFSGCWYLVPPSTTPADLPLDDGDGGVVEMNQPDAGPRGLDRAACTWNGKRLYGRIRYVDFNPDVKVKVVTSLARLHVREVSSLANDCGEWEIVTSGSANLRVEVVTSLPDLTIEYVSSLPGIR